MTLPVSQSNLTTTKPASYPKTPELNKMSAVKDKSQIIGAFLDQLSQEGVHLATYEESRPDEEGLFPLNQSIEVTLAKYFDIDLDKVERERRAILEHIRSAKL